MSHKTKPNQTKPNQIYSRSNDDVKIEKYVFNQLSILCLMFKHLSFSPVNGISIPEKKNTKNKLNIESESFLYMLPKYEIILTMKITRL